MAFAITNTKRNDRHYTSGIPTSTTTSGTGQVQLADQNADIVATNMGVAGLKYLRGRLCIKSGMANTNTFVFNIRVDTVVGMSSPELIYQSPVYTYVTNDDTINIDFEGWSEDGFQYVSLDLTNSGGTAVFDLIYEAY